MIGYNTDSRYRSPSEAADRVSEAVTALPAATTYKKVDSTLRGNVGIEIDAALRSAGAAVAVFAPAYPEQGRTTRDGTHYVDDEPIDATTYAADAKGPDTALLTDLFADLGRPVTHLSLDHVREGRVHVRAELQAIAAGADEPPIVAVDATKPSHLATVAAAIRPLNALPAGSAGLAKHLRLSEDATEAVSVTPPDESGPLGIVGSVNPETFAQLRRVPSEAVFTLEPAALVSETVPRETVARVADRIRSGEPAVITAATDEKAVERTVKAGERRGLVASRVRDRVAMTLGMTGLAVIEAGAVSGLLVTGGDVALATLRHADGTGISLTGTSIAEGMPVGRVMDGSLAETLLVTKAGGFGERNALRDYFEWGG